MYLREMTILDLDQAEAEIEAYSMYFIKE